MDGLIILAGILSIILIAAIIAAIKLFSNQDSSQLPQSVAPAFTMYYPVAGDKVYYRFNSLKRGTVLETIKRDRMNWMRNTLEIEIIYRVRDLDDGRVYLMKRPELIVDNSYQSPK